MPSHNRTPKAGAPTNRQLAYLRRLAEARGVTFVSPSTKAQASREIDRLLQRKPDSRSDRLRETKAVRDAVHAQAGGAVRVRDHELEGHGSTAAWSRSADEQPTDRQVQLIARLGAERGTTFEIPATRTAATILIDDLLQSKATWKAGRS